MDSWSSHKFLGKQLPLKKTHHLPIILLNNLKNMEHLRNPKTYIKRSKIQTVFMIIPRCYFSFSLADIWTLVDGAESMVSKLLGSVPKFKQWSQAGLVVMVCFSARCSQEKIVIIVFISHVFMGNNSNKASCT